MGIASSKTVRGKLAAIVIGVLVLPACSAPSTIAAVPGAAQPAPSGSLLPREVVIALTDVQSRYPELTVETDLGWNPTASGSPAATRSVAFTNSDGSKKVTISVDSYASTSEASAGYQQAVQLSRDVAGFTAVAVPALGEEAFAGNVTQDGTTHIGIGVLDGKLVLGSTSAGYDATPENIAKLSALTQAALTTAKNR